MGTSQRLRALVLVLPTWISMILTGGQWCLIASSGALHPTSASRSATGLGTHAGHAGHAVHASERQGAVPPSFAVADRPLPASPNHGGEGRSCEMQAACTAAIAPVTLQLTEVSPLRPQRPLGIRVSHPTSRSLVPELPPPRA